MLPLLTPFFSHWSIPEIEKNTHTYTAILKRTLYTAVILRASTSSCWLSPTILRVLLYRTATPARLKGEAATRLFFRPCRVTTHRAAVAAGTSHQSRTLLQGWQYKTHPKKPPKKPTKNVFFGGFFTIFLFLMKIIQTFLFETDFL